MAKLKRLLGEYHKTKERTMRWQCVVLFPSDTVESALITAQIDNLLLIKELPAAQVQQQKHPKQLLRYVQS